MTKVLKESFYEANFRVDEEFDNAELAAKSNTLAIMLRLLFLI